MKSLILSLFFASLFFNAACQSEKKKVRECTEENTIKMPKHAWDFLIFKQGSWWVYKEEKTGARDSVWVSRFVRNLDDAEQENRACACNIDSCLEKVRLAFASTRYQGKDFLTRDFTTYFIRGKLYV